jgi:hypothetical protein
MNGNIYRERFIRGDDDHDEISYRNNNRKENNLASALENLRKEKVTRIKLILIKLILI